MRHIVCVREKKEKDGSGGRRARGTRQYIEEKKTAFGSLVWRWPRGWAATVGSNLTRKSFGEDWKKKTRNQKNDEKC